jgi:hypothetical protein
MIESLPAVHSNLSTIQDPRKNFNHYFHEDRETKDVTVWGSIKHLRHSPMPALVLGVSGLIPFITAPAYMMYSSVYMGNICFAQMTYGATILSFLGIFLKMSCWHENLINFLSGCIFST